MYKQLALSLMLISSLSFAFNLPFTKPDLVKQAKLEAQEKHHAEKEDALSDLETALVTITSAGTALVLVIYFADQAGGKEGFTNAYGAATANTFYRGTNFVSGCLAAYASYKGIQGAKHLLDPDHPKPEEK